jgi:hypothetical protein
MPYKDPETRSEHRRQHYLANREKELAQMAEWRGRNPGPHADARRRSKLRVKYGLTIEGYNALLDKQGGVCAVCGHNVSKRALHVDHDHGTGKVRGLLCNKCNRGMGLLGDDVTLLKSAIAYLERDIV